MEDDIGRGNENQKTEYVRKINSLINQCNDIDLLDFIFQLLTKSKRLLL